MVSWNSEISVGYLKVHNGELSRQLHTYSVWFVSKVGRSHTSRHQGRDSDKLSAATDTSGLHSKPRIWHQHSKGGVRVAAPTPSRMTQHVGRVRGAHGLRLATFRASVIVMSYEYYLEAHLCADRLHGGHGPEVVPQAYDGAVCRPGRSHEITNG